MKKHAVKSFGKLMIAFWLVVGVVAALTTFYDYQRAQTRSMIQTENMQKWEAGAPELHYRIKRGMEGEIPWVEPPTR